MDQVNVVTLGLLLFVARLVAIVMRRVTPRAAPREPGGIGASGRPPSSAAHSRDRTMSAATMLCPRARATSGIVPRPRAGSPTVPATLAERKAATWAEALRYRIGRQNGTCATPKGVIQIDEASRLSLSGAVQMATLAKQAGQPFVIAWTMADNSVVEHDADATIAMGVVAGLFVNACQAAGTAVRLAIEAAADTEALAAIDIAAGYPD